MTGPLMTGPLFTGPLMTGGDGIAGVLPALLVFSAVWLLSGPRRSPVSAAARRRTPGRGRWLAGVSVAAGVVVAVSVSGSQGLIWSVCAAIVLATVQKVARDHRRRVRAHRRSRAVTEAARALSGRLSVGEVPSAALATVAAELAVLEPVQRAQEVAADVPQALMSASRIPGQELLAGLARAWRMAETTGAPLAAATSRVARAMRRRTRLEATLDAELAGPRASGRLLGLLPLAGLGMAQMVGADPGAFLLESSAGRLCVLGAVALSCAGVLWSEALANLVYRESLP